MPYRRRSSLKSCALESSSRRQVVKLGKNVALIRDMTDTMYNPARPPGGTHFDGTDRVIEHVERYWCPSFVSTDLTGKPAFRFKGDNRPVER